VLLSEEAGRRSRYGSIIAPPTFAAALAVRPCAEAMVDVANGIDVLRVLHGDEALVVSGVVRPGDQLDTVGEIVRIDHKPRFDVVVIRTDTLNQRGEKVLEVTSSWVAGRPSG
jgi:acyl dehydratase